MPRADYDHLRATLHRAAMHGPDAVRVDATVDLRAHLRGQVAWVASLHPRRGEKLRRLLDAIVWDDERPV